MKRFGRGIDIRGTASPRAVGLMGIIVALGIGLAHGAAAQAPSQSTATNPLAYEFDVATIMPSRPSPDGGGVAVFGEDTFRARNYTLRGVIRFAYETPIGMNDMLSGGPDWLDSESYDVTAKMDAATADRLTKLSPDERKHTQAGMVQELLADRLKLAVHGEPREVPVYFLTVAKNGPKLKEAKPGDTYEKAFPYAGKFADAVKPGQIFLVSGTRPGHNTQTIYAFGVSIPTLASQLTFWSQRTVQDRTGLAGSYDVVLEFCKEQSSLGSSAGAADGQAVPSAADPCGVPPLLTAVQQQLGLKLESGKGPVEIVVIDHVERPSGN